MKIAAYIRVSTDRQVDHGDSIDNQLKLAEQWCEKKGYELAHIYDEGGASAYRDKRRVFKEMLLDIKQRHGLNLPKIITVNLAPKNGIGKA